MILIYINFNGKTRILLNYKQVNTKLIQNIILLSIQSFGLGGRIIQHNLTTVTKKILNVQLYPLNRAFSAGLQLGNIFREGYSYKRFTVCRLLTVNSQKPNFSCRAAGKHLDEKLFNCLGVSLVNRKNKNDSTTQHFNDSKANS